MDGHLRQWIIKSRINEEGHGSMKGHGVDENLTTLQKTIEFALGNVAHCTKAERESSLQRTPDDVRMREEAAARCTKVIKREVLKKQVRKARAQHLVKCCLTLGKKKASRKPLYVEGHFTEDRGEWQTGAP